MARAGYLRQLGDVVSHAVALAVRRRFAREPDLRYLTRYVAEALAREEGEPPGGERARRAESVVRAYLGEVWLGDGLAPEAAGDVGLSLLGDLVRTPGMAEPELDELIANAERRAVRFPRPTGSPGSHSRSGRWRRGRGQPESGQPDADTPDRLDPAVTTWVGQWLWLSFVNDKAARSRLPDDPDEATGLAVLAAAFDLAVRRRFGPETPVREIAAFVQGARQRYPEVPAGPVEAELLVRGHLGEPVPVDGIDPGVAVSARFALVLTVFDALGLYDREVHQLLVAAEHTGSARVRPARCRRTRPPESRSTPTPDLSYDIDSRPISLTGRWLQLSFLGDEATLSRLPEEPNEAAGRAVTEAAFALVTQRRFTSDPPLRDIMAFVQGARQRFPSAAIDYSAAELLVRQQLGERVPVEEIDPRAAGQIRTWLVLAAFDDLGLYDHEVDELLVEAENRAVAQGFRPNPAPWPGSESAGRDDR